MDHEHNLFRRIVDVRDYFLIKMCTMRCFSRMSVVEAFHTVGRSWASRNKPSRSKAVDVEGSRSTC
jgi:hypothetical protein